jgi:hypothetical protein
VWPIRRRPRRVADVGHDRHREGVRRAAALLILAGVSMFLPLPPWLDGWRRTAALAAVWRWHCWARRSSTDESSCARARNQPHGTCACDAQRRGRGVDRLSSLSGLCSHRARAVGGHVDDSGWRTGSLAALDLRAPGLAGAVVVLAAVDWNRRRTPKHHSSISASWRSRHSASAAMPHSPMGSAHAVACGPPLITAALMVSGMPRVRMAPPHRRVEPPDSNRHDGQSLRRHRDSGAVGTDSASCRGPPVGIITRFAAVPGWPPRRAGGRRGDGACVAAGDARFLIRTTYRRLVARLARGSAEPLPWTRLMWLPS